MDRIESLCQWVAECCGGSVALTPASSDASFRRYWRVRLAPAQVARLGLDEAATSVVVMDAPPEYEDCGRFIDLARRFRTAGVNTPAILAEERTRGFVLLGDFGACDYLTALAADTGIADVLYADALSSLLTIQTQMPRTGLPPYDEALLRRELGLFNEWFLAGLLGLELSRPACKLLERGVARLVASALEQPMVCVHRDFHSRNLMVVEWSNPGVLDFQDAVAGPVTYDLVSLLRDCYIAWPPERVRGWALGYRARAQTAGIPGLDDTARFLRWFDLMGMQRHLKVCGIFARLKLRDDKPRYLQDLPRVLGYLQRISAAHEDFSGLAELLAETVAPRMRRVLAGGADSAADRAWAD